MSMSSLGPTGRVDTFARDNLPPAAQLPEIRLQGFHYSDWMNAAVVLSDRMAERGFGDSIVLISNGWSRTYKEMTDWSNCIAHLLVENYEVKPGNRLQIWSTNPAMVTWSLAVTKAGAVVVNTLAEEQAEIIDNAAISHALCDTRLMEELVACQKESPLLTTPGPRRTCRPGYPRACRGDRGSEVKRSPGLDNLGSQSGATSPATLGRPQYLGFQNVPLPGSHLRSG
jgi:hypothetical protein